ncbi:coiled-coil domain-containing protein 127-like [Diretmus argenteus]
MNNVNDPPRWNNQPEPRRPGDGDGNQWNYALLVAMLGGLAAFCWIWTGESQREIQKKDWYQRATATLKELEGQLVERQHVYCSYIQDRDYRLEMEKNMLLKVVKEPIGGELDLETDLKDIFKRDTYCAGLLNTNKRKNGNLMWLYLKHWQLQLTVQKQKRAEEAVLREKTRSHTK